jgi:alpha-L-fucosidase 2
MRTSVLMLAMACCACGADFAGVEYGHPGKDPLLMDIHVPVGKGPFPAAILVHGGGFDAGSRATNVRPIFEPLANGGFAWFSIDYRLAPEAHYQEAVADVNAAIRWVKAHAAEYHVDAGKVAIVGESAGGFLVNYVGTHQEADAKVAAVVDFYGPTDYGKQALERKAHPERFNMKSIDGHAAHGGGIHYFSVEELNEAGLAKLRGAAPLYAVKKDMPPFLIIHGTKDDQVSWEQSVLFQEAMKKAGVPCEFITIENGGHGMGGWRDEGMQHYKAEMVAWLKKTLQH